MEKIRPQCSKLGSKKTCSGPRVGTGPIFEGLSRSGTEHLVPWSSLIKGTIYKLLYRAQLNRRIKSSVIYGHSVESANSTSKKFKMMNRADR